MKCSQKFEGGMSAAMLCFYERTLEQGRRSCSVTMHKLANPTCASSMLGAFIVISTSWGIVTMSAAVLLFGCCVLRLQPWH